MRLTLSEAPLEVHQHRKLLEIPVLVPELWCHCSWKKLAAMVLCKGVGGTGG